MADQQLENLQQVERGIRSWARSQSNPEVRSRANLIAQRLKAIRCNVGSQPRTHQLKAMVDDLRRSLRATHARAFPKELIGHIKAQIKGHGANDDDAFQIACALVLQGEDLNVAIKAARDETAKAFPRKFALESLDEVQPDGRTLHDKLADESGDR